MAVSLAIVNARVWTGDPRRPWADAVAVDGDRVQAVGSSAEVRKLAATARVIDAKGAVLLPGATDAPEPTIDAGFRPGVVPLRSGARADLVLIDRVLTHVAPETIRDAVVLLAVVGGVVRFER